MERLDEANRIRLNDLLRSLAPMQFYCLYEVVQAITTGDVICLLFDVWEEIKSEQLARHREWLKRREGFARIDDLATGKKS